MIEVRNLTKAYGSIKALSEVTFSVGTGEVIGLLGPNGAGKTTLMKVLAGYLQPDCGTAVIDGLDVLKSPMQVQQKIGYLPENAPLYPELTVQSYLQLIADLRGISRTGWLKCISEAVYSTGLTDRLTMQIGQLSKGYRQRVGLAQAILHKPGLLILDEPTSGLDPTQIMEVRRLIRRFAGKSTVLLSTHILSEVEATCDRAIIIMNGRIKTDARLSELSTTADAVVTLSNAPQDVVSSLQTIAGVDSVETLKSSDGCSTYRLKGSSHADLCPAVYELASRSGWHLTELKHEVKTLESVFNELAMQEGGVRV